MYINPRDELYRLVECIRKKYEEKYESIFNPLYELCSWSE